MMFAILDYQLFQRRWEWKEFLCQTAVSFAGTVVLQQEWCC